MQHNVGGEAPKRTSRFLHRQVSPLRPSARPTTCVCGGRGTPGYAEVTVMLSTLAHIGAHRALETSGQTNLVHKQMCCRRGIKILVFWTCFTNKEICFLQCWHQNHLVLSTMTEEKVRFRETRNTSFSKGTMMITFIHKRAQRRDRAYFLGAQGES